MAQNKSQGTGTGTSNRGFASMDVAKQREIASKGGRSVAAQDRSFSQNRALAAQAGRKGGQASHGGRGSQRRGAASASSPRKSEASSPDGAGAAVAHGPAATAAAKSGAHSATAADAAVGSGTESDEVKGSEH